MTQKICSKNRSFQELFKSFRRENDSKDLDSVEESCDRSSVFIVNFKVVGTAQFLTHFLKKASLINNFVRPVVWSAASEIS